MKHFFPPWLTSLMLDADFIGESGLLKTQYVINGSVNNGI